MPNVQIPESEKPNQSAFKQSSPTFTPEARQDGFYRTKHHPFCLPLKYAEQNLFPAIRESALQHFAKHEIKWQDGQNGKCSNHMCDSQVCCVNFLFPFADQPDALAHLLSPSYPQLDHMLPVEDGKFVSFEWIGAKNYLGEKISRNGERTRGANFTSADAIVIFERTDNKRQIVLIEWKYTESYGRNQPEICKELAPTAPASTSISMTVRIASFKKSFCPTSIRSSSSLSTNSCVSNSWLMKWKRQMK